MILQTPHFRLTSPHKNIAITIVFSLCRIEVLDGGARLGHEPLRGGVDRQV